MTLVRLSLSRKCSCRKPAWNSQIAWCLNFCNTTGMCCAGSQQTDGSMPVRQFLQTCAAVINREPTVFFEAVLGICTIRENNGRPLVVLKKAKVLSYQFISNERLIDSWNQLLLVSGVV